MEIISKLSFLTLVAVAVAGVSMPAHAALYTLNDLTIDQILYKLNPAGGLTVVQAANLDANVDMTFESTTGLLTVTLTNTSGPTTGPTTANASNLLTGLGFQLPGAVTVIDTPSSIPPKDSTVAIASGSTLYNDVDPPGPTPADGLLSQNDWGWRGNNTGGHFSDTGVLSTNLIVSTSSADVLQTFSGGNKSLVNGTDYGLKSASGSPGPANGAYIQDSIVFSIYLSGVTDASGLLAFINSGNVVVAYGSPADAQGQILTAKVPEPLTLILYGFGFAGAGLYRHLRRKRSVSGLHS